MFDRLQKVGTRGFLLLHEIWLVGSVRIWMFSLMLWALKPLINTFDPTKGLRTKTRDSLLVANVSGILSINFFRNQVALRCRGDQGHNGWFIIIEW